mmetsp:Transcript_10288/g.34018  ORF Transcript_10288/g.34018 Transcript_10288/m.34018 type:complete len:267 (+) Transcript_10288:610-1410(+)
MQWRCPMKSGRPMRHRPSIGRRWLHSRRSGCASRWARHPSRRSSCCHLSPPQLPSPPPEAHLMRGLALATRRHPRMTVRPRVGPDQTAAPRRAAPPRHSTTLPAWLEMMRMCTGRPWSPGARCRHRPCRTLVPCSSKTCRPCSRGLARVPVGPASARRPWTRLAGCLGPRSSRQGWWSTRMAAAAPSATASSRSSFGATSGSSTAGATLPSLRCRWPSRCSQRRRRRSGCSARGHALAQTRRAPTMPPPSEPRRRPVRGSPDGRLL